MTTPRKKRTRTTRAQKRKRRAALGPVVVHEILSSDDRHFAAAHRLLRSAFPRAEMLPVKTWRNAMEERREGLWTDVNWHVLVATRGRTLLGAASGSYLGNVNIGLVGYIAVKPEARSLGLGPRLRRKLLQCFKADARHVGWPWLKAMVGEVQRDNPWLPWLVRNERAIALDFPYVQPALGHTHPAVPLVLYYQPVGVARRSIPAAEVRRLLYTIWRRAYRVGRPLANREFRRMLASLKGRGAIGSVTTAGRRRS